MNYYVTRNPNGTLKSVHGDLMPGYNDEMLPDTHPEIVAWLSTLNKTAANALIIRQIEVVHRKLDRTLAEIADGAGDVADPATGKTPRQFLAERHQQIKALRAQLQP